MSAETVFDQLVSELEPAGAEAGTMFGSRAITLRKKAFVCLKDDRIALKLGAGSAAHSAALALPGSALWDPSGTHRPYKDWVSVPASDAKILSPLAGAALTYLREVLG
ncbi:MULTISPECIES: hypothetical protein [unclassified Salinibacterium]|uniref:hypothetical protein n=1 Tax=unclassified Salinibacterium TaxID=2632331 RepID=UPI00174839A4|nr:MULTISPECIES: hypothetical protein [unclassified Salinibacterium]